MARKVILGVLVLCALVVTAQYTNHATQRSAVGRVLAGRLTDLNLVGEDRFRSALIADLRDLQVELDEEPNLLIVERDEDRIHVEVHWVRRISLGLFGWEHALQVTRDTTDLGM